MGHSWFKWVGNPLLNGLGIYNLMGGAVMMGHYGKVSTVYFGEYAQKMLVFRGIPILVIT